MVLRWDKYNIILRNNLRPILARFYRLESDMCHTCVHRELSVYIRHISLWYADVTQHYINTGRLFLQGRVIVSIQSCRKDHKQLTPVRPELTVVRYVARHVAGEGSETTKAVNRCVFRLGAQTEKYGVEVDMQKCGLDPRPTTLLWA